MILGFFLIGCFNLEVDQLADRLANLSIVLLTYIATMGELRGSLPEINRVTCGEKIIIVYILASIFPIVNLVFKFVENISYREYLMR